METIIAFSWGVVTMFFIGMFVVVVQLKNQVKQLSLTNQNLERYISDVDGEVTDLQRQLDSRFDKFENKITNKKEILKG